MIDYLIGKMAEWMINFIYFDIFTRLKNAGFALFLKKKFFTALKAIVI